MNFNSRKFKKTLLNHVATVVAPYRSLLLAFSGGLDSTALLDILTTLSKKSRMFKLRAYYIHHGLNKNAEQWAIHCERECIQRNITFNVKRIMLNDTSAGIEATARNARYRILADALTDDEVLLTAQHQDDQVETFLLALKRGSGPTGLAAMPRDIPFFGHRLIRPLLDCSRVELERYVHEHRLSWIEDDSNNNLRFDRNFLRLKALPLLHQRWPQFTTAVVRSAQLCAEQETLLDELLEDTLSLLTLPDGTLHITPLITMSHTRRAAILRRWLAKRGSRMPSRCQLEHIWQDVILSRCDSNATLQIGDCQIRRFRDHLYLLPKQLPLSPGRNIVLKWPLDNVKFILPLGLGIILRHILYDIDPTLIYNHTPNATMCKINRKTQSLHTSILSDYTADCSTLRVSCSIVRAPLPGEKVFIRFSPLSGMFYISGRCHRRALKKIWQELDVPPWKRGIVPLLFYNDVLIAAIGVFITREGENQYSAEKWHLDWYQSIEYSEHF